MDAETRIKKLESLVKEGGDIRTLRAEPSRSWVLEALYLLERELAFAKAMERLRKEQDKKEEEEGANDG